MIGMLNSNYFHPQPSILEIQGIQHFAVVFGRSFFIFYKIFILQIRLNPRPWRVRWERVDLNGVEGVQEQITQKMIEQTKKKIIAKVRML